MKPSIGRRRGWRSLVQLQSCLSLTWLKLWDLVSGIGSALRPPPNAMSGSGSGMGMGMNPNSGMGMGMGMGMRGYEGTGGIGTNVDMGATRILYAATPARRIQPDDGCW
ncbi:hypothetical protein Csa_016156 [Cucumis sativus]|nr:hypothetical protein Csa_016156 [Cucumis sativus]